MKKILFSFIITAFSLTVTAQTQAPVPGTAMPKAVFYKVNGSSFSTDQIPSGKQSLIMLFDATCEHCQKVAKELSKRNKELSNINFYMVTMDETRSINYFMDNFGVGLKGMKNLSILQDKDRVFIPLFHPKQYPSLYLYGRDKKLTYYSSNEKDVAKFFKLINP